MKRNVSLFALPSSARVKIHEVTRGSTWEASRTAIHDILWYYTQGLTEDPVDTATRKSTQDAVMAAINLEVNR